ncbi:hypothetical protein CDEN61S_04220 [Castellaniella denitrificans]
MARARRQQVRQQFVERVEGLGLRTEGLRGPPGGGSQGQQRVHAALAGIGADLGMHGRPLVADFGHVAQHQDAPAIQPGQHVDGGADGIRIGVVAVVDQLEAVGQRPGLHPAAHRGEGRQAGRDGRRRRAGSPGAGRRRQGVAQIVAPRGVQGDRHGLRAQVQAEFRLRRPGADLGGMRIRRVDEAEAPSPPVAGQRPPEPAVVLVGREHRHAVGGQRLQHGAVLARHGLDRAHEFLVLALRVVHQRHRRLGDGGQHGDLARMVHAQFQHGGAVRRAQAQHRQRQADVVVEVAARRQASVLAAPGRQDRGDHFLGRGLAVAAGHCDDRHAELAPPGRGRAPQGQAGVAQHDLGQAGAGHRPGDDGRARPGPGGRVQVVVAVEAFALERQEQRAGRQRAGVGGQLRSLPPGQREARPFAVVEGAAHMMDFLVGLVALAGQQHHVPLVRAPDAFQDGVGPVRPDVRADRHARHDLFDDGLGRFGARIVGGDHDGVGQPGRHAAHQGPLAGIPVAAAAEHAAQAAAAVPGQRTQGRQHPFQGIRRMRIIHHDQRLGPRRTGAAQRRDHLQAARHRMQHGQGAGDAAQAPAQLAQHAGHQQQVGDVVFPDQVGQDLGAAVGRDQVEDQAVGAMLDVLGPEGRRALAPQAVARPVAGRRCAFQQFPSRRVVGVDDRAAQARPGEQGELRLLVAFFRAVVVQVVAGQVGEARDLDADAVQAALLDPDRGRLDGGRHAARAHDGGQAAMQRQHVRRGQRAAQVAAVGQRHAQRPDGAAGHALGVQRRRDPLRGGRLAVGAGDGDHGQCVGRPAVPQVGDLAQQRGQALDFQDRHGGGRRMAAAGLPDDGGRAGRHGRFHVGAAVRGDPGAGEEHVARPQLARIQAEIRPAIDPLVQPGHDV